MREQRAGAHQSICMQSTFSATAGALQDCRQVAASQAAHDMSISFLPESGGCSVCTC